MLFIALNRILELNGRVTLYEIDQILANYRVPKTCSRKLNILPTFFDFLANFLLATQTIFSEFSRNIELFSKSLSTKILQRLSIFSISLYDSIGGNLLGVCHRPKLNLLETTPINLAFRKREFHHLNECRRTMAGSMFDFQETNRVTL